MALRGIAILGAGNGGCAAAADLTLKGHEVRLYSRSEATLRPIRERGGIEIVEAGEARKATPALVTSEINDAVAGADLIIIAAPAVAHEGFAAGLASRLRDGQIILLNPGHTGGSLHFAWSLRKKQENVKPLICETITLTYICRLKGPAQVEVYRRTTQLRCAAFPAKRGGEIVPAIKEIFPNIVPARNVMETGLSNINAIMHPVGMVANAGWLEKSSGDFRFYAEGITPAVANVIAGVDEERLKIVGQLGLPALSFVEIFYQAGLTTQAARESGSVYQAIHESAPNRTIKAPPTLNHRYLNEDVGYGLVPMAALGKWLGVKTPVIDALITIASALNRRDYRQEGLTLEKIGLANISPEDFETVLREGF
jgi:opine dehydrogenase